MAVKKTLIREKNSVPPASSSNGPLPADEAVARLANSRARMEELLQDPAFAEEARQALEGADPPDDVVERARAGEFAEQAFVSGYGAEFVQQLKSSHGG